VVSLQDILQAYGVTGEKGATTAAAEEMRTPRRLVPGVIAAGLAVLLVIGFLNYYYRSDRSQRAEQYYKTGNELLAQNRAEEAVQQYREALSVAPGNQQYRLALGLALAKADHPAEAAAYLSALLKREPENALANLGQARIAAARGETADAAKLYRRAIDGAWPAGHDRTRIEGRQELAELLAKTGQRREAAVAFREAIKADDRNASAYAGLGEVELGLENYQEARDAFRSAIERNPSDQASKKDLALSEQVLALDPNARGLRAAARYERSKELLQTEVMRFEACQPAGSLPDAARRALATHPRRGEQDDSADTNLMLAEDLWKLEQKLCGGTRNGADAIDRVLSRLAR
jgi:tetratricopeptide (TPR) repeat protein